MTTHTLPTARTPGDSTPPPAEPPGLTTFSATLSHWKPTSPSASRFPTGTPPPAMPGPRLLHDKALPPPPPGLPPLPALHALTLAAADRARRILGGIPLTGTPLADAVHIADTASLTDPTPAYRLDVDLGHWRELLTLHHTQGCAAEGPSVNPQPEQELSYACTVRAPEDPHVP
ncbi:hypothetical protein [Streptomyces microflavus]|uniref:hypothetical protein n=1 Tax=Streptomyces microflavus TaxID=1919 RepID=UPI0038272E9B